MSQNNDSMTRTVFSEDLEFALKRAADAVPTFLSEVSSKVGDLAQDWSASPHSLGVGVSAKGVLKAAKECFETWHLTGIAVKNAAHAVEAAAKRVGAGKEE